MPPKSNLAGWVGDMQTSARYAVFQSILRFMRQMTAKTPIFWTPSLLDESEDFFAHTDCYLHILILNSKAKQNDFKKREKP